MRRVMNPVCCCTGKVVEGLGPPDDRRPISRQEKRSSWDIKCSISRHPLVRTVQDWGLQQEKRTGLPGRALLALFGDKEGTVASVSIST